MAMEHQTRKLKTPTSETKAERAFELDALLHPANAFGHPMDVVRDSDLTLNEKRAILSSWASDACAVEAAPELRVNPAGNVVRWDDIMDALRTLDREAEACGKPLPHYKRVLARKGAAPRAIKFPSGDPGDRGRTLN
jgi:hypothetical protein